jgi:hypothetical protein
MFLQEIKSATVLPEKAYAAFFTNNKELLKSLIKELDTDEYQYYGTDSSGNFIIPIYELTADSKNNFIIPELTPYLTNYYGKYEIDINKLKELTDKNGVQFFLYVSYDQKF